MKNIKQLLALTLTTVALAATAQAADLVNVSGASNIAVGGYDTVAFFTDSKPVNGDPGISATYQGATYIFASKAHKELFEAAPEKIRPTMRWLLRFRRVGRRTVPGGYQHLADSRRQTLSQLE